MDWSEDDADAQTNAGGALADGRQGKIGSAVMGPLGAEVVLREPDAMEAHLLGVGDLLQGLPDAAGLAVGGPGLGDLNLVEESDLHGVPPM